MHFCLLIVWQNQKNPQHAIILATEVQAWLFLALSLIVLILELMMGDVIAVLAPDMAWGYGRRLLLCLLISPCLIW